METNRKWVFMLTAAIALIAAGCTSFSPTSAFPMIQSTFISPYILKPYAHAILTPNGKYLTINDLTQVELSTGMTSRPFDRYISEEWQNAYHVDNMIWLPDGKYLIVATHLVGSTLPPIKDLVFIIDTQTQTISEPLNIGPILYGSPFGEKILAKPLKMASVFWQVYDVNIRSLVSLPSETVNPEKEQTGGTAQFLWSRITNMPVAVIDWRDPINAGGTIAAQEVGITLSFGGENGELNYNFSSYTKNFVSTPPDNIVSAIFDPRGEYILIVQWKCSKNDSNQCSLYPGKEYFNNITDTALILVNWRTGVQEELIRLSQIDPLNVVAQYADWSVDGSTILVWRKDAPPIVLKIKYP